MAKQRRRQRTEDEQRREVDGWRASGQSGADYARARGYSQSSLTNWAARARDSPALSEPRIVRVEIERRRSELVVAVGSARVCVAAGFDAALLREVVAALQADTR